LRQSLLQRRAKAAELFCQIVAKLGKASG